MKLRAPIAILLAVLPAAVSAAEVEIEGRFGQALPLYEETYAYDPGGLSFTIPGLTTVAAAQRSPFTLDGTGSTTFGGSLTVYPTSSVGIEARIDAPAVQIEAKGAVYHITANLPSPLPDISQDFAVDSGTVHVDRLKPISLNLKLRTSGHVAFALSGGVSYLPTIHLDAQQPIGFSGAGDNPLLSQVRAGRVSFQAAIVPEEDQGSKIGGNAGAGLSIAVGAKVFLSAEARVFAFPKHRLDWSPIIAGPLSAVEQAIYDEVRPRFQPIDFNPTFFQATVGLAIRL
jgi:hypothetical protein